MWSHLYQKLTKWVIIIIIIILIKLNTTQCHLLLNFDSLFGNQGQKQASLSNIHSEVESWFKMVDELINKVIWMSVRKIEDVKNFISVFQAVRSHLYDSLKLDFSGLFCLH